jgi:hypothetical protein
MAHPKHKHSKTRRDKRRTHYKATAPTVAAVRTADLQFCITGYVLSVVFTEASLQLRKKLQPDLG